MPGFLTHYIAGNAALRAVSSGIREKISAHERLYNLGTQGPDIFFYYVPAQVLRRSRGIGQEMHASRLGLFLGYMARLAKDAPPQERDTIFAYTAGFAMHYAVDCHAHPYVYARTFDKKAKKIKNSAEHRKFETAIDIALLKLVSGEKPAGVNQWELINAPKTALSVAAAAFSHGLAEIYGRNIPPKVARRAMRFMIKCTRLLQSKRGRRKRFMEILERVTIRERLFSAMVHMQEIPDGDDFLNIKKTPWRAPWENDADTHDDSFMERYNAAVDEGAEMLAALYEFVYGGLEAAALAKKIGNRSLKTGLEAEGDMPCSA